MIEAPEDYAERAEGRVSVTGNERDCEHISTSWDVVLDHMDHGVHIGSYESKERAEEVAFVIQHEIGRVLSELSRVTEERDSLRTQRDELLAWSIKNNELIGRLGTAFDAIGKGDIIEGKRILDECGAMARRLTGKGPVTADNQEP